MWAFFTRYSLSEAAPLAYAFARSGIDFNNLMMEGPIQRQKSMDDLSELTKEEAIRRSPGIKFGDELF